MPPEDDHTVGSTSLHEASSRVPSNSYSASAHQPASTFQEATASSGESGLDAQDKFKHRLESGEHEVSRTGITGRSQKRWQQLHGQHALMSSSISGPPPLASRPDITPPAVQPSTARSEVWGTLRPNTLPKKRPAEEELPDSGTDSTPLKKVRTTHDDVAIAGKSLQANQTSKSNQYSSEPFFHTPRHMSSRTPTLSSSEAAAAMVVRMRNESEDVTTVRLPRGNINAASPATRSGSTQGSLGSLDLGTSSKSPDSRVLTSGMHVLHGIGVVELLEQDERPTFIIDLVSPANVSRARLHILYSNAALRSAKDVIDLLEIDGDEALASSEFVGFKAWITSGAQNPESAPVPPLAHSYGGITWTCSTLRKRFRFISGNRTSTAAATPTWPTAKRSQDEAARAKDSVAHGQSQTGLALTLTPTAQPWAAQDYFGRIEDHRLADAEMDAEVDGVVEDEKYHSDEFTRTVLQSQLAGRASYDWTRIALDKDLPEHILFARTVDWASTPLGPIESWGADLRVMSNLIMGSPHPAAMYWGPEHVAIYNEAYIEIAGQKHPSLMGARYRDAWAVIWDEIEPVFQEAFETGQAIMKHEDQLFIDRHDFLEESFFSWSIVPIVGGDGEVVGLYNPAFENTRRRIGERRMLTLREVGEATAAAPDVKGFWQQVLKGLEYNGYDVPFALVYSVKNDEENENASMQSGSLSHPPQLVLEGSLGVPASHPTAAPQLDLRTSEEAFAPYMREAMRETLHKGNSTVVLSTSNGTLPTSLVEGFEWRGFGDPCTTVVILPVHPAVASETVVAFIVLGVNPRRPYDDDFQLFINLLSRQLSTSMASVILFEEEVKRSRMAAMIAEQDNQELSKQLVQRTQEAVESEYKFTRMAEFAPVGMFIADPQGFFNYCNDMWWDISRHPRSEHVNLWMDSVRPEDREALEKTWGRLVNDKVAITHEFRFKSSRKHDNQRMETWALMSAYPEKDAAGSVKSIFGCITDISPQKWAEYFQKRRREEAVELKRQQENFIDITSHEMRNPLSAILQCADEIFNGVAEFRAARAARSKADGEADLDLLLESCTDAANTINLCASHQKRIVDDILTLSKLDSQLLLVTPVDVQPAAVVQHVLKMFETEVMTHDVLLEFQVEQSYLDYEINWVRMDPSRLSQVVINLMTNAIKFTQNCDTRIITVSIGASKPSDDLTGPTAGVILFPSRPQPQDLEPTAITNDEQWGDGEEINLHFSVRDTGPGIGDDEKQLLFQRFSQTTPRTHVRYGGSGLGLFISRMLTELQGGQIGVTSEKGVGSTFSFYVKARKSDYAPSRGEALPAPAPALSMQMGVPKPDKAKAPLGRLGPAMPARRPSTRKPNLTHQLPLDVLIVEDNLVNQKVLQKQLRNQGSNTHVANHGGEALEILKRSRFWKGNEDKGIDIAVVLMDLEMPVMDGKTCAKRIRKLEDEGVITAHVPVIAVTAYARPEQIEEAKASGMDDVISKPFRIPELIPKIKELATKYGTMPLLDMSASPE